jgi:hypothetical protein
MVARIPQRAARLLDRACEPFRRADDSPGEWRDSDAVCALSDSDRHLGHTVRVGNYWIGYDAIHLNPTHDGFRVIGTFASVAAAKEAVENSVNGAWELDAPGIEPVAARPEFTALKASSTS